MLFPTFKTQAEVPAAFVDSYEERDGTWQVKEAEPDTSAADALAAETVKRVAAEKSASKAAYELKKLQTKLQATDLGVTAEALETTRAEAKKEAEAERDAAVTALAAERTANKNRILLGEFKSLAGTKGFISKKLDDLAALHSGEYDLTDDGKLMVKGKLGLDPAKHMETIAKIRPEWVEGTRANGGGTGGEMRGGAPIVAQMTVAEAMNKPDALFLAANAKP